MSRTPEPHSYPSSARPKAPYTADVPPDTEVPYTTPLTSCDVLVVGAGLAGLTAAENLSSVGFDVQVIEARSRVGGRTEGAQFASGTTIELGGQWLGPTQDAALALVERLGLKTFTVHDEGRSVLCADGERFEDDGDTFGLKPESSAAFTALVGLIDQTAANIYLETPWTSSGADVLDSMTASQWLDENCPEPGARAFADTILASIFAAESYEYSALHMLFYLGSGGGLHRMMTTVGGAQELRVRGGTHLMAEKLAEKLEGKVALNTEVLGFKGWNDGGLIRVFTTEGDYVCNRVIVTVPPVLASRMRFDPPLPAERDTALARMSPGDVIKFQIEYETPFWREQGLSGTALDLERDVSLVYDNCVPDSDHGILVAFVEGRRARALGELSEDERAMQVITDLVAVFGHEAGQPIEVLQRNWSDETFTRGCYGGRFATGLWTTVGHQLSPPSGNIHWAGTETAAVWNGYIDGAIRSGERAAGEVIAASTNLVTHH